MWQQWLQLPSIQPKHWCLTKAMTRSANCFRANLFIKLQEKGGKRVRAQPNRHKAWDLQTSKSPMLYKSCPPVSFTAAMLANCSRCIHSLANLTHGAHLHTWKIYTLIYGTQWFLPYSHHKPGLKCEIEKWREENYRYSSNIPYQNIIFF